MFKKKLRGQTTIELLVLLSISMVALTIIFAIYIDQVNSSYDNQDFFLAKSSVQKIVSAVNTVYYAGPGSEIKVEFEFPRDTNFSATRFIGSDLIVQLKNGHTYIGGADVNVVGNFKPNSGKNMIYLFYDGNSVKIHYNDFEVNKQNISVSAIKGDSVSTNFTIRNNSSGKIKFYLDKNFSHNSVELNVNSANDFNLPPGEVKKITVDFNQLLFAQGNYSGYILVIGEINDINFSRKINVSLEVLTKSDGLVIYPKDLSFESNPGQSSTKSFSICNSTQEKISINSWGADGPEDRNAAGWISALPNIVSVSPRDCNSFDLTFNIPSEAVSGKYDANIFAALNDSNVSSNISITIPNE